MDLNIKADNVMVFANEVRFVAIQIEPMYYRLFEGIKEENDVIYTIMEDSIFFPHEEKQTEVFNNLKRFGTEHQFNDIQYKSIVQAIKASEVYSHKVNIKISKEELK